MIFAFILLHAGFLPDLLNMEDNFSWETFVLFHRTCRSVSGDVALHNHSCEIPNPAGKYNFRVMEETLWNLSSRLEDTIILYCVAFLLLPFLLEHRTSVKHFSFNFSFLI
jgi:hypothetical protein